ncbi:MAG: discoidin domain-containing protein [Candidatus Symbiothrix sp.]|jgi:hypothetical protein|nr:discoidin domain-containing protein [Candidatus Symbiothrix sp.]
MKLKTSLLFFCLMLIANTQAEKIISLNSSENVWQVRPDVENSQWINARVPATVFVSYVEAGLEKDPNFGDNIHQVDNAKYDRNFWYQTQFEAPALNENEVLWLHFEGINRKGEIYLNGARLGLLDGFMHRGKFDITSLVNPAGKNELKVLVHFPGNPIPNYASPTYISAAGWDWMPYTPGLLSGITDDVYLSVTGVVSLVDPWIRSSLVSADEAQIKVEVELKNSDSEKEQQGYIQGAIYPGNVKFKQAFKLPAGKQRSIQIGHAASTTISVKNPQLWWPNGYGDPNLYTCDLQVIIDGKQTDSKSITFGIKEYSYEYADSIFRIKINGQAIFVKGGNWGMSEYLLRCRGEEYDWKVRLHKEMNYNMIRNWIGSVTDEEFYAACDKYGIMVWDDFWLNSHANLPDDVFAFNQNAVEKIKRLRNHPSIAVWCGDNEGYPLPPLNAWLTENVKTFDGGDRHYQANSNSDGLSGSGPWTNFHPNWYFSKSPQGFGKHKQGDWGFRSEIGTAVFTSFESFKKFMPEKDWWPADFTKNEIWNKHFFGQLAANAGPEKYFSTIELNYGKAKGIEDFCRKAQLLNYESNKAMYEGWLHHIWNDATGIMTWMSQSAYPSFVWQTYDYYYDLTGAYWGVKKACEPLHIQWSYADNSVKAINTTLENYPNLNATARVYTLAGAELPNYRMEKTLNVAANTATDAFQLKFKTQNLTDNAQVFASSVSTDAGPASSVADGLDGSRWASNYTDDEWLYLDLGEPKEIGVIVLNWEAAHAESYLLQISDDAQNWKTVYSNPHSKGGIEEIKIKPVRTRYLKMLGLKRATYWGYSLYEIELYGKKIPKSDLTPVHFIRLELSDEAGNVLSDNFYWRSLRSGDYRSLNSLPTAQLAVSSEYVKLENNRSKIQAGVRNTGASTAFAIHIQAFRKSDGERILPFVMNQDYFTLFGGESTEVIIEFDSALASPDDYELRVIPYN